MHYGHEGVRGQVARRVALRGLSSQPPLSVPAAAAAAAVAIRRHHGRRRLVRRRHANNHNGHDGRLRLELVRRRRSAASQAEHIRHDHGDHRRRRHQPGLVRRREHHAESLVLWRADHHRSAGDEHHDALCRLRRHWPAAAAGDRECVRHSAGRRHGSVRWRHDQHTRRWHWPIRRHNSAGDHLGHRPLQHPAAAKVSVRLRSSLTGNDNRNW